MKIGLLGCGVVGKGVLDIIDESFQGKMEVVRILVKTPEEITDERMTTDFEEVIQDESVDTIVECMGGLEPAHTFAVRALSGGRNLVTSNKKMFAVHQKELRTLARENHCAMRFEACVGGGIPWIAALEHMRRIDRVSSFSGIMNGTTNYILSDMNEKGTSFADALGQAQKLGYAEADPSDDIDGYDVRYKCAISVSAAFGRILAPEEIPAFGIRHVSEEDIRWGKQNGRVLKLMGRGHDQDGTAEACVIPVFVKNTEILAGVSSNLNAIQAVSSTLGPSVYIGQGAGRLPTAHAVVQDLCTILEQKQEPEILPEVHAGIQSLQGIFYIRSASAEILRNAGCISLENGAFRTETMSFGALTELVNACEDPDIFVAEVLE